MSKNVLYSLRDVEEFESYKILNNDKPSYITIDEWELLKVKMVKLLTDFLIYSIHSKIHFDKLEKYFKIKKPVHFPDNQWKEIIDSLNDNFIQLKKLNEKFYISYKDIIKELNAGMPDGMSSVHWENYENYLLKRYYEVIYREMLLERAPLMFLEKIDLSILSIEQQNTLKDLAYKIELANFGYVASNYEAENFLKSEKPKWIRSEDLAKIVNIAEKFRDLEWSKKRYRLLLSALHDIAHRIPLNEKPDDQIEESEWNDIKELESKTSAIAIKIENDLAEIANSKQETNELKSKILRQLEFVNEILGDPNFIERIEPYDNPFSKGNFENLKKVSNILRVNQ